MKNICINNTLVIEKPTKGFQTAGVINIKPGESKLISYIDEKGEKDYIRITAIEPNQN